jgi:hypothetical protein
MDLSKILSIAGKPGLYKVESQSNRGVVVSSIQDGKKMAIGQTQRVSTLSDISIYTMEGDEPLKGIFEKIYERTEGKAIDVDLQNKQDLRDFFLEVLPDHDEERVYASDIKKMIKWFNLLLEKDMLDFSESEESDSEEGASE